MQQTQLPTGLLGYFFRDASRGEVYTINHLVDYIDVLKTIISEGKQDEYRIDVLLDQLQEIILEVLNREPLQAEKIARLAFFLPFSLEVINFKIQLISRLSKLNIYQSNVVLELLLEFAFYLIISDTQDFADILTSNLANDKQLRLVTAYIDSRVSEVSSEQHILEESRELFESLGNILLNSVDDRVLLVLEAIIRRNPYLRSRAIQILTDASNRYNGVLPLLIHGKVYSLIEEFNDSNK